MKTFYEYVAKMENVGPATAQPDQSIQGIEGLLPQLQQHINSVLNPQVKTQLQTLATNFYNTIKALKQQPQQQMPQPQQQQQVAAQQQPTQQQPTQQQPTQQQQ